MEKTRKRLTGTAFCGLLALAFALAWWAQAQLDARKPLPKALAAYGMAALLFALLFRHQALEREPPQRPWGFNVRWGLLFLGTLLSLSAFPGFGGNRFRLIAVIPWIGGIILVLLALNGGEKEIKTRPNTTLWSLRGGKLVITKEGLALGAILALGAFYRLYRLDEIPADIGWDLPHNYFDVQRILRGQYMVFFPANQGREGMFFYFIALLSRFMGLDFFTLKFASALVGMVTIVALYLLARDLFGPEVGLWAAALMAVNKWHVVLSRIGFRVILMPLFAILALYALRRALEKRCPRSFGLTGLALGLGFYSYKAALYLVAAFLLAVVLHALSHRQDLRRLALGTSLALLVALLLYIPLARYATQNPQSYFERERVQLSFVMKPLKEGKVSLPAAAIENLRRTFLMFNYMGDPVSRVNVPFQRHFGFVSGMLLVLGMAYLLTRPHKGYNAALLSFWFVTMLPATVSMVPFLDTPSLFRSSGVVGMAVTIAALPLALIRKRLAELMAPVEGKRVFLAWSLGLPEETMERRWEWVLNLRPLTLAVVALILAWEARGAYHFCFREFVDTLPDRRNYSFAREIARELDSFAGQGEAYVKFWPHWYDGYALRMNFRVLDKGWNGELYELDPTKPPLTDIQGRAMFILHPEDEQALSTLKSVFPRWVTLERRDYDGNLAFIVFYGEK